MKEVGKLGELDLKAGDVVEHVSGSYQEWPGVPWLVCDVGGDLIVRPDSDWESWNRVPHCTWTYRIVSRANSGPVRMVTRKEIVPGVYGKVQVFGSLNVSTELLCGVTELRAAIATMTQIADALEESK